jgi:hypothetical protein
MRSNYLNFLEPVLSSIESEVEFDVYRSFSNICDKHRILKLFFIGHLWILEFRTVSKYANFVNIWPIWERIFPIEIEYFFEKFLSISFRIWIVSNRTTSISVKVSEYRRYLVYTSQKFHFILLE